MKSEEESENAETEKEMDENVDEQTKPAAKGKRKIQARKGNKTQPLSKAIIATDSESDAGNVFNNLFSFNFVTQ